MIGIVFFKILFKTVYDILKDNYDISILEGIITNVIKKVDLLICLWYNVKAIK